MSFGFVFEYISFAKIVFFLYLFFIPLFNIRLLVIFLSFVHSALVHATLPPSAHIHVSISPNRSASWCAVLYCRLYHQCKWRVKRRKRTEMQRTKFCQTFTLSTHIPPTHACTSHPPMKMRRRKKKRKMMTPYLQVCDSFLSGTDTDLSPNFSLWK